MQAYYLLMYIIIQTGRYYVIIIIELNTIYVNK